jgi:predicted transposase/invertase (TIGR01784 family)
MWLAFLTRNDLLTLDNLPKELNDPDLKKAINVLNVMNFTPEEREAYEDHLKWLRIEANTIKNYEQRGEVRGREEVSKSAKLEAKAERDIEIAKNLLEAGLAVDLIAESTGLPVEEIIKLKN